MQIKGCAVGRHSDIKPGAAAPLGGAHVRGQTASDPKLKKIEDFNAGKKDEAPLELLKRALVGIGCSAEDFDNAKAKLAEKFKDDDKDKQGALRPPPKSIVGQPLERVPPGLDSKRNFCNRTNRNSY